MAIEIRRVTFRPAAVLAVTVAALLAQDTSTHPEYKYDVVSIHRSEPAQMNSSFRPGPQGGLSARNVTVLQTLTFAYRLQDYQFLSVPGWATSERFDITFTPDRSDIVLGPKTTNAELDGWIARQSQRMRAVLQDRFGLVLREETRQLPMYGLKVAKGGPKLSAPKYPQRGPSFGINGGQQIVATTSTMKSLAESLATVLGRPVEDETGLDGTYDFKLDWSPDGVMPMLGRPAGLDPAPVVDAVRPSIFTALTEQLGLRLESKKGPVKVYVIDKVERPSEN